MGRIVQACYRPKSPEHVAELESLLREHLPTLRAEGLATGREAIIMRSSDGTIVEVFEWIDDAATTRAHTNAVVQALWGRFEVACEFVTLGQLPEAAGPFGTFDAVDLSS